MFAQVWEGELCGLPALDKLRLEPAFAAAVLKADSSLLWEHLGPRAGCIADGDKQPSPHLFISRILLL